MDEINVDVENLKNKISDLKQIRADIQGIKVQPDSKCGGGGSIDMLYNITEQYEVIQNSLLTLLDNSIGFFENVENSFVSSDNTAASKIK